MFMTWRLEKGEIDQAFGLHFLFAFELMRAGVYRRGCIALGVQIDQLPEGLSCPKQHHETVESIPIIFPDKARN